MVEAQGARRAAGDVDKVARATDHLGDEADRAGRKMRSTRAGISMLGAGVRGLGTSLAYGATAAAGLTVAFGAKSVAAWEESRKVASGTAQVIRSTGGAANVTAMQVGDLAGEISGLTGVDDEAIQSGANMLLRFKNIRNEQGKHNKIFNDSVGILTDMSVAMGTEPQQAAIQLGKALNDPIRGVTALQRVGITFDEQQRKNIETWVKQGETMKAQKLILGELRSEFGGQAKAQGTALDKLKVQWGNIEESVGSGLQPVTDKLFDTMTKGLSEVQPLIDEVGKDLSKVFGRDDLDLTQKIALSARRAKHDLNPLVDDIGDELRKLFGDQDLGVALGTAIDRGVPIIANHAAAAAPKAAKAFIGAWWDMDPAAKLFSVALLAGKLGAFRTLGGMAANRFANSFDSRMKTRSVGSGGVVAGGVETGVERNKGRFALIGNRMGGFMAGAMGASIIAAAPQIYEELGRQLGLPDLVHEAQRGYRDLIPGMEEDAGNAEAEALAVRRGRQYDTYRKRTEARGENPMSWPKWSAEHPVKRRARGGVVRPGEFTITGEDGWEIMRAPAGTEVYPHGQIPADLRAQLGNGGGVMRLHPADITALAREIGQVVNDKEVTISANELHSSVRRQARLSAARTAPV